MKYNVETQSHWVLDIFLGSKKGRSFNSIKRVKSINVRVLKVERAELKGFGG